jgi:hypothetical protein
VKLELKKAQEVFDMNYTRSDFLIDSKADTVLQRINNGELNKVQKVAPRVPEITVKQSQVSLWNKIKNYFKGLFS